MTEARGVARDQLRAFIERIERLEEEKKTIADDIKDVYAEAKGMGFIPAMMKKVIALRKKDEMERMEEEAILDTYLHALGMISQPDLFEEPHPPETGELIDPKLAQTIVTGMQTEIGRKALIAAVDIMIAREEAEEEFHTNLEEEGEAKGRSSVEAEDRTEGDADRQRSPKAGTTDGGRQGDREQVDSSPVPASNPEKDTALDASAGRHSLDAEMIGTVASDGSVGANTGGDDVDRSVERASGRQQDTHTLNNRLDGVPVQSVKKPLRPLCRNPGDNCGGYGSTHCASCLRASKQVEVAA